MSTANVTANHTFDEIAVGDTASLTRQITDDDIAQFVVLAGDVEPSERGMPGALTVRSMLGGALISAVLGAHLPGPGTIYVSQSLRFHRQIAPGDSLTTTVTVREKNKDTRSIFLDCVCVDARATVVMTGVAEVIAPAEKATGRLINLAGARPRRHDKYEELIARCRGMEPARTAIVHPCSGSSLVAAVEAAEAGLITPILVGPKAKMEEVARKAGLELSRYEMVDVPHSHAAADAGVQLILAGKAQLLMKGSLHTDELLSAVVRKDGGLRTERRISHCFIMDVPSYPKPLVITDAAININPNLDDKVDIIRNAIDLAHAFGRERPRVAIVSAVETVNPKISSTIDAAALSKMADRGQITGAIVDGPLALDNAISREAADIKGIVSPIEGEADIVVVPDLESGNLVYKNMSIISGADGAGIVLGARVPIILTSRADSTRTRLASCAVAMLYQRTRQSGRYGVVV
jgi:phosphate acetyltransferase